MKKIFATLLLLLSTTLSLSAYTVDNIPNGYFSSNGYMCDTCTNNRTDIRYLQVLLNADDRLSVSLTEDGYWGNNTKNAVKSFQSEYGLGSDGHVGNGTKSQLDVVLERLKVKDEIDVGNKITFRDIKVDTCKELAGILVRHEEGNPVIFNIDIEGSGFRLKSSSQMTVSSSNRKAVIPIEFCPTSIKTYTGKLYISPIDNNVVQNRDYVSLTGLAIADEYPSPSIYEPGISSSSSIDVTLVHEDEYKFKWDSNRAGIYQKIYLYDITNGSSITRWTSGISQTTISNLIKNHKYYWKMKSCDGSKNNCGNYSSRLYFTAKEAPDNRPLLSSVYPTYSRSSLDAKPIRLTGENFSTNSVVQSSRDNTSFTDIGLVTTLLSSNLLTFDSAIFSKTGYIYYRIRNGTVYSPSVAMEVDYSPPFKPKLFYVGDDNKVANSNELVEFSFFGLDLDDLLDKKLETFRLSVDWGDGQEEEYTKNYLKAINISHRYNTDTTRPFTLTVKMKDSDNYASNHINVQTTIKGSSSSAVAIKDVRLGSKPVAIDPCAKTRSEDNAVDKASGAENFSITPLKVKGLFDLALSLQYNSLLLSGSDLSKGWSHNFTVSSYLEIIKDGDIRLYWDNSAKKYNDFTDDTSTPEKKYTSLDKATQDDVLILENDETYTLKRKNGSIYKYDILGYLTSISNYKNQKINIMFNNDGQLGKVEEPVSNVYLNYFYNNLGKLERVEDNTGRTVHFTYSNGLLYEIQSPSNIIRYRFTYNVTDQLKEYKVVDKENNVIDHLSLEYYDTGEVAREYNGKNIVSNFAYDKTKTANRIHSLYTDKANNTIRTIYDDTNFNPYKITYADTTKETFEYYTNGKRKRWIDRAGNNTRYYYDTKGNMNKVLYADTSYELYTYDTNRNITKKIIKDKDGLEHITRNIYGGNNLTKTTLPDTTVITYTYGNNNQLATKTIDNKTTKYTYNTKGYLKEVETPENLKTSYTYDVAGRLKTETNPQGGISTYTYDVMDNVTSIKNPAGKTQTFKYNFLGQKTEQKDFMGHVTKYEYDTNGNMVKTTDAENNEYRFEYDSTDRLKKSFDPLDNFIEYEYDSMGRVSKTIDKRGNATSYAYDVMGNLKSQYDATGFKLFTNTYNSKNQLIKSVDSLNQKTTTDYTVFGKPSKVTDPLLRVTEFKYDKVGRLLKAINAKSKESSQIYTPSGELKEFTDAGGSKTEFTYDDDGKLLTTTTASGSTSTNVYDVKGLLNTFTNGRNDSKTFKYDNLGRVTEAKDKDGTIAYTYDDNSNVKTIKENGKTASYVYDKLNRVVAYTDVHGDVIDYGYDAVGNLVHMTYPHGTHIEYDYDANSNLIEVKDGSAKTIYSYDKNDRLLTMTRPNATVLTRVYNNAGQLTTQTDKTSTGTVISSVSFEYDKVGNIIKEERVPDIKPLLPVNISMSYKDGNLLDEANQTQTQFDADDNMLSFGIDSYTYDSRNRLMTNGTNVSYVYDSQNHRVSQTIGTKTTTYTVNPNASLSELLEMTESNGDRTVYTYGLGLLSQEKNAKTLYYHYDLRGSTIAMTDESGNIVDRFSYLPFGGKLSHDVGSTETPFLYNGRDGVMTDESGLYYMRARYYDPNIRRFINRDTLLGEVGQMATLNRFGYVNGNPVSGVDPLGLYSWSEAGHDGLDLIGLIPLLGEPADLANGVWYSYEGDVLNSSLSFAAAVPGLGYAASASKAGMRVNKYTNQIAKIPIIPAPVAGIIGNSKITKNKLEIDYLNKVKKSPNIIIHNASQNGKNIRINTRVMDSKISSRTNQLNRNNRNINKSLFMLEVLDKGLRPNNVNAPDCGIEVDMLYPNPNERIFG